MVYRHTTNFASISPSFVAVLLLLVLPAFAETSIRANTTGEALQGNSDKVAESEKPVSSTSESDISCDIDKTESLETKTIGKQNGVSAQTGRQVNGASLRNDTSTSLWKTFFSLLIVLALIVVLALLFRWFSMKGKLNLNHSGIEILARNTIGPKQSLCLIKVGGRLVLIGQSPNHMASLHTVEDDEEIAHIMGQIEQSGNKSITNTFGRMFHREAQDYDYREVPDGELDISSDENKQWSRAKGELGALLSKVKGLSRLHSKL